MPALFVVALLVLCAGVGLFIIGTVVDQVALRRWSIGVVAAGLVLVAMSAVTSVAARSVGVVLAFGKPVANLGPGFHVKAPWHRVVEMDGSTQTEDHTGDRRTEIRLGNQATGFVQNSLRWKLKPEQAPDLYADYLRFDNIGPKLVDLELAAAMNVAFADYDPLANIKADSGDPTAEKITNDDLASIVQQRLDQRIGDRIIVEQVVISKVDFDAATQARIDDYQAEIANTRIAEQREQTAAAEARANRALAESISDDPNVLVSKCLDQQAEMIEKGQPIPLGGLGCWPGSAQPEVIVQQR